MVRRRLGTAFFVLAALAGSASTVACAAVFGFERLSVDDDAVDGPVGGEGSTEGGADTAAPPDSSSRCAELGLPNKPGPSSTTALAPIHMALKLFDLGIDTNGAVPGFNLDHVCSPTVATSSCKTNVSEAKFGTYARDRNGDGLDNSGYGLLAYLAYLGEAFQPVQVNKRLANGEFGFVVRLVSWNGTPEDDDVLVEVFPTIGVALDPDASTPVVGGKPKFDAADRYIRDRRFQNIVDASRLKSASAYVTGGRLVASFDAVSLPMSVPDDQKPLDIIIQEGILYGSLVKDGASWKLADGVLAGRWRTADILAQVRTIFVKDTIGLKNVYLCDPDLMVNGVKIDPYKAVKTEVCDGRDLRASSADDNKGLGCQAVSAGIRFDSYAVSTPGTFGDRPAIAARCQKPGSVPEGDDCAP